MARSEGGVSMYAEGVWALGQGAARPRVCECGDRALAQEERDVNGRVDVTCLKCGKAVPGA